MIDRVFSFAELPACCSFTAPAGETVRASVVRINRSKVVLDWKLAIEEERVMNVQLEVLGAAPIELVARVFASGESGLYLRFLHEDAKSAARLQTLLVEKALAVAPSPTQETARKRSARVVASVDAANAGAATSEASEAIPDDNGDMRANILRSSRRMSSAQLAARHRDVQVVSMSAITRLIAEAADEALKRSELKWASTERERLLKETEASFSERLEALKAEKAGLHEHTHHLETQLARAQTLLDDERQRVVSADQFTVSDAGLVELEQRLERLVRRVVRAEAKPAEAEAEMREMVLRILDDERSKISQKAADARSEELALLESKVKRLATTLDETRSARDEAQRRAQALEQAGGSAFKNIMTAGLASDDPRRDKKMGLLKELMSDNRQVRAHIATRTVGAPPAANAGSVKKTLVEQN
ncbi:MAG: hypothetical protein ACKVX7_05805 [Planctomycetota bacterium]